MNKEIIVETLKDALAQLGSANELMAELTAKDKVTAHIEMAKAYALTSIAVALSGNQEQAPETVAETKKPKKAASKKEEAIQETPEVPEVPAVPVEAVTEETVISTETTEADEVPFLDPAQEDTTAEAELGTEPEAPLVSILDGVWVKFNRAVIENEFDYSAWFMEFVNAVDENNNPTVGAGWANEYMVAFTAGQCTSVEDLNDDNAMAYINFVIDAVNAANQQ